MFALCAPGREILQGIAGADSITVDPHKGLFLPCGTGAVLVKDGVKLWEAHRSDASYLRDLDTLASADEISPSDLSPELTRPFRGLRLWLPLKLAGVAPFRAALEEKLLLARYFHERIQAVPGFAVGPPPDLSIVTFRYVPRRGDANRFNEKLAAGMQQSSRVSRNPAAMTPFRYSDSVRSKRGTANCGASGGASVKRQRSTQGAGSK
jgi:glutamate/tyrosine decarboxylase-like PLP-dependent enzyme